VGRNRSGRGPVDSDRSEIDEGEMVLAGRGAREGARCSESFVDESLGERSGARPRACLREAIERDHSGRLEEVGDELGDRVRGDSRTGVGLRIGVGSIALARAGAPKRLKVVEFHLIGLSA
jgi:hypothetical protein